MPTGTHVRMMRARTTRDAPRRCSCGGLIDARTGECSACRARRLAREGRPLDSTQRKAMEARFGHDFSAVRVHPDPAAARAQGALAFTAGEDIVLGDQGQSELLLAHELAHVVQQSRGTGASGPEPALEADAEAAARAAVEGRTVAVRGRAEPGTVQRAAPVAAAPAAAVGLGALAWRCVIAGFMGVLLDIGIQFGIHSWNRGQLPFGPGWWRSFKFDWCSMLLAAFLGCVGGMISLKWLEPWMRRTFPSLISREGTIIGAILLWAYAQAGVTPPKVGVKFLLTLRCISLSEAEALAPGVGAELEAEEGTATPPPAEAAP